MIQLNFILKLVLVKRLRKNYGFVELNNRPYLGLSKSSNQTMRSLMEQRTLKNVNNYLITNIYSYSETSGGQSSNLYIYVVHFFNTRVN
jgi:hypothetical protein